MAVYDQLLDLTKNGITGSNTCIFILAVDIAQAMKFLSFIPSFFLFSLFLFNNKNGKRTKSESLSE